MSSTFLAFADLILVLRIPLLLSAERRSWKYWLSQTLIELAFLILLTAGAPLWTVAGITLGLNAFGMAHRPTLLRRDIVQLGLCALHLVLLSVLFAPAFSLHFSSRAISQWHSITGFTAIGPWLNRLAQRRGLKIVFGVLLSATEGNLLIRSILDSLKIKPPAGTEGAKTIEYNRGRVIGLFERALIFLFVLNGQYAAVGFTLTAKGFTRFKDLDNRDFAEYAASIRS